MTPTENVTNQPIQQTQIQKCVEDAYILTCSRIKLKPLIEKIEITDRRGTEIIYIKIKGLVDSETVLLTNGILGKMLEMGFQPRCLIHYLGTVLKIGFPETSRRNSDPPL